MSDGGMSKNKKKTDQEEDSVEIVPTKPVKVSKKKKTDPQQEEDSVEIVPPKPMKVSKKKKKTDQEDAIEPLQVTDDISQINQNQDKKQTIIDALDKMKKIEISQKQTWKAKAYDKVIKQLRSYDKPVISFDDVKYLPGIGEAIEKKIKEIIETGTLHQLHDYNADGSIQATTELLKVHGIGPVKAKDLVEKHGIKTIEDLKSKQNLLNDVQKKGLLYYEDTSKRIPRSEMEKHEQFILDSIKSIDSKLQVELTGSFRRKLSNSGDIDVLITHSQDPEDFSALFKSIVLALKNCGYIKDVFAEGSHKCLAVCKLKRHHTFRRIDLLYTRKNEFPFALMYFTGSGDFNVDVRNLALSKGYSLSEHGMKHAEGPRKGEFVEDHVFDSENDIFAFLGMEYIPPEKRIHYKQK
jgi:DNA polymerase/3'-5' exonuclease PolX